MMVDRRFIEADRTIADLRSQLKVLERRSDHSQGYCCAREGARCYRVADLRSTTADLQLQLEALKRSATQIEDLKTKLETTRSQLEAAQRVRDEYCLERDQADEKLQAERTKREEAERMAVRWQQAFASPSVQDLAQQAIESERRLSEALAVLEELSEAAFWYGNSRSKRKPTNADRKKGDAIFAALDRARAVLRHGESAMAEGTEAETENPRREPGA